MSSAIDWPSTKALSFDIFGTLIDWESGIYDAARASLVGPYLPSRSETLNGIDDHDVKVQAEHPTMLQSDVIAEGFRRYVHDLGLVADGKLTQDQVDAASKEYGAKIGQYPAFEDTVKAIQTLGKRFKLIPLSNVDRASFSQTLSGPLKGCHFDAIYTAQDIGSYKPDLKNFHYLLDHLKGESGLRRAMGLTSVWVDRKGHIGEKAHGGSEEFGYQLRVETLGELAQIVEQAFAKA